MKRNLFGTILALALATTFGSKTIGEAETPQIQEEPVIITVEDTSIKEPSLISHFETTEITIPLSRIEDAISEQVSNKAKIDSVNYSHLRANALRGRSFLLHRLLLRNLSLT